MYEELVNTLRQQCSDMACGNCNTCVIRKAADAIEKLMEENKRLKNKIRDMKSSASWDEDIRRGQVQGMW